MKVFCLGGAGKICREAILDLVQFSSFETITVADFNEEEGRKVVEWLDDPRVDFVQVDVTNHEDTVAKMKGYDIVMDGTTIKLNGLSTRCIAEAGCHGVNLNGFGEENESHDVFVQNGKTCLPGFGMTPGVTQMMAMYAANQLDSVESVRVSHGSYRPIAFSASITETTTYEYDPKLPTRTVFENGEFKQVPPFARPREIELPEPYGKAVQYIIPHSETITLAKALKNKGVQLIETRGTWPQQNMQLVRALYDYGILRNDTIEVNGKEVGIMDCISNYLLQSKEGQETAVYGYALHIEVIGEKNGQKVQHILYHTHPTSDGSVEGWENLRAYTRNVGIPFGIATELIANGEVKETGVVTPEEAFQNPKIIFGELEKRGIYIHEEVRVVKENYDFV
ncbi:MULTISPECIES: saccharopine dehydrogenase family protein [Bacillus cereus group]|uniref:Saccharopine dehydrogenase n=1 Tax=Bacillus cereus TaxID=1396 RepID=A0AA44QD87_BACCE|nr:MULTISPECIES: saccharopine dehydrogenase C-terminal domain-containing protein [Bacillus cereus group]PFN10092.1 saccharopine dehydrogenase [Bacillus cereus]PFO84530.1 saccharopine dehydrogenase [Bacillus cereus]PFR29101.1 saccharopine dehydrogenase [Bacillus cereus]PFS05446.1 saccharopine dehydrogenase [Bacillus cereus]PGZ17332.1 saccharopine dehydrogenase [Bacillus cereus]